ncbi:MAG: putative ABC-type antimicrobial peptide transport system, ATPase component, partial [Arthrobacter koreensis]|nr:putative ABC-type antimicrobial peptide transport system, ATPase component [Arthrobacter koreensis]
MTQFIDALPGSSGWVSAAGETQPLVRLRNVTRTVRLPDNEELHILGGVDLDVRQGDHISIVGRSGSG